MAGWVAAWLADSPSGVFFCVCFSGYLHMFCLCLQYEPGIPPTVFLEMNIFVFVYLYIYSYLYLYF